MMIFEILKVVAGAAISAAPLVAALIKSKRMTADEKAEADMKAKAQQLVLIAENSFADINDILKDKGKSAGGMKKQNVMTELQQYAITNGYTFDREKWSDIVESIVTLTKQVN